MNIETIKDYVNSFKSQVIESGFRRDVTDFIASTPNNQGNIVGLKEIAKSVFEQLQKIHEGDLPDALQKLFPSKKPVPFTAKNYHTQLSDLLENKTVQQDSFFTSLHSVLKQLQVDLETNTAEVDRITAFIAPYTVEQQRQLTSTSNAIFSIIFKDQKTIGELNELSKTLSVWNRTLPLYHQLVTNTSPANIEILGWGARRFWTTK